MKELIIHPTGETKPTLLIPVSEPVTVETFGGRIHVDWNPDATVTPLGQLPFFIEFLHISGLFDEWVANCPLRWTSPNAPDKRDVLGVCPAILIMTKTYPIPGFGGRLIGLPGLYDQPSSMKSSSCSQLSKQR